MPASPAVDVRPARGAAELAELAVWTQDEARRVGHELLNETAARALEHPSEVSAVLVARGDGEAPGPLGVVALTETLTEPPHVELVMVCPAPDTADAVIAGAIAHPWARAVPRLVLWSLGSLDVIDGAARRAGFRFDRELWRMEAPLPLAEGVRWPAGVRVRDFEPGRDDEEWVAVNNRSFAGHPEQSGWTVATLRDRMAEPWFDPHGFVLAVDDDGLAGFCWTKVHPAVAPLAPRVAGEIYVIGVDPSRQGTGLGRALVVGGLERLVELGAEVGMLFVDAANDAAVGLYRTLGFTVARADTAYVRDPDATP